MPFDDQFGGTDPVDPQAYMNNMLRQRMPEAADQSGQVDPNEVLNRLLRGAAAGKLPTVGPDQERQRKQQQGGPKDFVGSYGQPLDAKPKLNVSDYGTPLEEPTTTAEGTVPVQEEAPPTTSPVGVGAKEFARGAAEGVANIPAGAAVLTRTPRTLGEMATTALQIPFNPGAVGQIAVGAAKNLMGAAPEAPASESPLYKASETANKAIESAIPVSEQEQREHPIVSGIAKGIGGMVPAIAAGAVDPALGVAVAAGTFGLSGAAQTYKAAKEHGADEATAERAATYSAGINAALGVIPAHTVFAPLEAFGPGASTYVGRIIYEAGRDGIVFAGVGELQEYLGQKLAQMYDQKAEYKFDFNRLAADFASGAILGGAMGALRGRGAQAEAGRAEPAAETEAQPQPQPQPGTGGGEAGQRTAQPTGSPGQNDPYDPNYQWGFSNGSWYRDAGDGGRWYYNPITAKWDYKAQSEWGGARAGQQQAGGQQQTGGNSQQQAGNAGQQGAAGPQQTSPEPPPFETKLNRATRDQLEKIAGYYNEHTRADIRAMSDDDLKAYVTRKSNEASTSNSDFGRAKEGEYADLDEVLRRYGYNDDDIAAMSPAERAARYQEAVRNGTMAGEEQAKPGARGAPIDLKTGADVERAGSTVDELYSHAQGAANNIPRVHVTWNGMDATLEAGAGGVRHGIAADGTPFTQRFPAAHGYFKGTTGADEDHLDAYFGPHPGAPTVYVLDEKDPETGAFRQHKAFVGFQTPQAAVAAYTGTDGKHSGMIAGMRAMSREEFKNWASGDLGQPASDAAYNNVRGAAPSGAEPTETPEAPTETPEGSPETPSGPLEATPEHHQAVENAIREAGIRPDRVRPVDIARAAEIMAAHGLPANQAFPIAVASSLLHDGHISPSAAEALIGHEETARLLAAWAGERPAGEPPVEAPSAGAGRPTVAPETGVAGGGHENAPTAHPEGEGAEAHVEHGAEHAGGGGAAGGESQEQRPVREPTGGKRAAEAAPAEPVRGAEAEHAPEHGPAKTPDRGGHKGGEAGETPPAETAKPAAEAKPAADQRTGTEREPERPAVDEASNFEVEPATRVATEQEAQRKGGQYTAVARRRKPWSAERGYGDTPLSAQNDALRRLGTTHRLREPVEEKPRIKETEALPPEHPGLIIKSLETGKETHLKPKGARDWTEIGKNEIGQTLYEDQNGVRSYIENGIRHTEPVGIIPTRGGISIEMMRRALSDRRAPNSEYLLASEIKSRPVEPDVEFTPEPQGGTFAPGVGLARSLAKKLAKGEAITNKVLQDEATKAFGGTMAEGKFDRKTAYDSLELAVNLVIKREPTLRMPTYRTDNESPMKTLWRLEKLLSKLPTQTVRSEEQLSFQQFSTPPNYAASLAYAAALRKGDVVLEPSAGTGSIVAAASSPGVKIIANELAPRRADLLRELVGDDGKVYEENAEQLDNILPPDVKPTVVLMNPPFSQTAGRMGNKKVLETGAVHIEQALGRLEPGGRLVAIVGQGMAMDAPRFRDWWKKIASEYAVRDNIPVAGEVYAKYGTTFGTRLLVIDKVKPGPDDEVGGFPGRPTVHSVEDLMRALEPVRNGRPQQPPEPSRVEVAEGGEAANPATRPVSAGPGALGPGERGGGGLAGEGQAGAGGANRPHVRVEAGERPEVASEQPGRPGPGRAGERPAEGPAGSEQPGERSGAGAEQPPRENAEPTPGATASGERIEVESAAPGEQAASDISDSLYENYEPQRVRIKGAAKHPGPLVESAAMASVLPPDVTYKPAIPQPIISQGKLSLPQLEVVVYAGQAHSRTLPAAEGEAPKRKGFFIGDGTGVGKGREIAGIILDNFRQGRDRAVWVSEKKKLMNDAKRDWSGLGQDPKQVFDIGKVKAGDPVTAGKGIGFITYDTLKNGMSDQAAIARGGFIRGQEVNVRGRAGTIASSKTQKVNGVASYTVKFPDGSTAVVGSHDITQVGQANAVKSRIDQIADWVGPNFDGVIAFDEAHNMGNASDTKGARGVKEAAQKALAGIELQKRLPNARVVYVSATGATEVSNLAYADRLGLWGRGTPFASRDVFVNKIEEGGVAAMELVARDMKQLGLYIARNLSYDGVEYSKLEHKLDKNQREIYDTLAGAWQIVLKNFQKALEDTGGKNDWRARSAASSAFWGAHQRFFNQIVTSLQMPSVVREIEKDLKAGRQVVLQLTNTNAASQERAAAKAESAEDIEDLDITPRDSIIQLIEKSFPTQQYEEYVDENGKVQSRPVLDKEGKPVQNKQAVAAKERLIDQLSSIRVPQGPLDLILDHFGVDTVAEVTGRGRRFVIKPDPKTGERKRVEESRPASSNQAETDNFQAGKKRVLVFSEAGGTGASYHADNAAASKKARRVHYLLQAGWRADKAVQGFGRTHRTNQASAPIFRLVSTDLSGQKRFISSIARRLGQLGALTKGERKAADQGVFSQRDNLESTEARIALRQFFADLLANRAPIDIDEFEKQTGLELRTKDDEGRVTGTKDPPEITQFLNRLLSLNVDMQNKVFEAFSNQLDAVIEARQQAGILDTGLETVRADKIRKDSETVVHTDPESKAETKHVKLTLSNKFKPIEYDDVANNNFRKPKGWVKSPQGRVYAVTEASHLTDAKTMEIIPQSRIIGPSSSRVIASERLTAKGWDKIDAGEAKKLWQAEIAKAPEYIDRDMHLITGAVLPIWDRLKGSPRVIRTQTDKGERFIGREIPNHDVAATMSALGAEAKGAKTDPKQLHAQLMAGGSAKLSNGWRFKRSLVAGEDRIELIGPSSYSEGEQVKADGAFTERIQYTTRYFIPVDPERGAKALGRIIEHRPIVEQTGGAGGDEDFAGVAEGRPAEAIAPTPSASLFTDLGPYTPDYDPHLGRQAQNYILHKGRETGLEHIVGIDKTGEVVLHASGSKDMIRFPSSVMETLRDPSRSVVLHHNHPDNSPPSPADIGMLAYPGVHSVWAHGHNGNISRAILTPLARDLFANEDPSKISKALYKLADAAGTRFVPQFRAAVASQQIEINRAAALLLHLSAEALRRAGLISYISTEGYRAEIDKFNLDPQIDGIANEIRRSLLNANPEARRNGGPAQPARHIGEVGTTLRPPPPAPGRYGEQARADRVGGEAPGPEPAVGEQTARIRRQLAASQFIRKKLEDLVASDWWLTGREHLQDFNARVQRLQEMVEARSNDWISDNPDSPLPDKQQFYQLKRLFPGKRAHNVAEFNKDYFRPLADVMKAAKIKSQEASDYLYAWHAPERNRNVGMLYATPPGTAAEHQFYRAVRDPNVVGASGMSTAEARRIIREFEDGPRGADFRELAQLAAGIRNFIKTELLRGHLESADTISQWTRDSPNYVPLTGHEDPDEGPQFADTRPRPGRGSDIRGRETMRAFGRRTKADNVLVSLLDQAYRTIDRAEKNLALHGLARMLKAAGEEVREELGVSIERGRGKMTIDKTTGLARLAYDTGVRWQPGTVVMKVNGKEQYVQFKDQRLADAVKRWAPHSNAFLNAMGKFIGVWKSLLTHYNPEFLARHSARYFIEGLLNSFEEQPKGDLSLAKHAMTYAVDAMPVIGTATRAIWAAEHGHNVGHNAESNLAKLVGYWREMKAGGGAVSMFSMREFEDVMNRMRKKAESIGRSGYDPREVHRVFVEFMDKLTTLIDNSTRLAAYSRARDAGRSIHQASMIAREATIDYNLRGLLSNWAALFAPFQNVATQTGYRMGAAAYRSSIMRKVFLGMVALGFGEALWNYFFGGQDKDKRAFYDKLPPWVPGRSLVFFAGLTANDGKPLPLMFPLPYNYAFPHALGSAVAGFLFGTKKKSEYAAEAIRTGISATSELGEQGVAWRDVAPEIIRPFMDTALNTNWRGSHIHATPEFQHGPKSESGFRWTPEAWKDIAQFLNRHSGGDRRHAGYLDFYPEDIKYIAEEYLGGQVRLAENVAGAIQDAKAGKLKLSELPVVRVFAGTDYQKSDQAMQRERKVEAKRPWEGHDSRPQKPLFNLF